MGLIGDILQKMCLEDWDYHGLIGDIAMIQKICLAE